MYRFSRSSIEKLDTCHPSLQRVFYKVLERIDCTIIEGHRTRERQRELFDYGRTKTMKSRHLKLPSEATDAAPYVAGRIPWPDRHNRPREYIKDLAHFYYFAGIVLATAAELGVPLRWGGDWDRDHDLHDQTFDDLVHFELHPPRGEE